MRNPFLGAESLGTHVENLSSDGYNRTEIKSIVSSLRPSWNAKRVSSASK